MKYKIMIELNIHGADDHSIEEYDGILYDYEEAKKICNILKKHNYISYIVAAED